jgi:hypothetical protein
VLISCWIKKKKFQNKYFIPKIPMCYALENLFCSFPRWTWNVHLFNTTLPIVWHDFSILFSVRIMLCLIGAQHWRRRFCLFQILEKWPKHNIVEPIPIHLLWSPQKNLICTQRSSFLYTKILICSYKFSSDFQPAHSPNATYTYKGLGNISFPKDGVLTSSRMLWAERCFYFYFGG